MFSGIICRTMKTINGETDGNKTSAKLWDEFAPNLTELRVKMGDDVAPWIHLQDPAA